MNTLWQYLLTHYSTFTMFVTVPLVLVNVVYALGALSLPGFSSAFPRCKPTRYNKSRTLRSLCGTVPSAWSG